MKNISAVIVSFLLYKPDACVHRLGVLNPKRARWPRGSFHGSSFMEMPNDFSVPSKPSEHLRERLYIFGIPSHVFSLCERTTVGERVNDPKRTT